MTSSTTFVISEQAELSLPEPVTPEPQPESVDVGPDMLISPEYQRIQREFHLARPEYGQRGHKHGLNIIRVAEKIAATSILDYGAGKQSLHYYLQPWLEATETTLTDYDPARPGIDTVSGEFDLVVCTDVLEHIEPDLLPNVIKHIASLTRKQAYLLIHTGPAKKNLPDGRNAHLIQQPGWWWLGQVLDYFHVIEMEVHHLHVEFVLRPRDAFDSLVCSIGTETEQTEQDLHGEGGVENGERPAVAEENGGDEPNRWVDDRRVA